MPQERIEWTCPTCNKRYAIPASANLPEQCPSCQKAATSVKEPVPTPVADSSPPPVIPPIVTETPFPNVGEVNIDAVVGDVPLAASHPVKKRKQSRQKTTSRKYPALRTISLTYRVIAFIIVGLTILVSIIWTVGFLRVTDFKITGSGMFVLLQTNMGILLGGGMMALFSFAASELIVLFIDIEDNTRQQQNE